MTGKCMQNEESNEADLRRQVPDDVMNYCTLAWTLIPTPIGCDNFLFVLFILFMNFPIVAGLTTTIVFSLVIYFLFGHIFCQFYLKRPRRFALMYDMTVKRIRLFK